MMLGCHRVACGYLQGSQYETPLKVIFKDCKGCRPAVTLGILEGSLSKVYKLVC